jgi:hypothetical protein
VLHKVRGSIYYFGTGGSNTHTWDIGSHTQERFLEFDLLVLTQNTKARF